MLGLGAVVEITPAGSPLDSRIYVFLLDSGQYGITGSDVLFSADRSFDLDSGAYLVTGSVVGIGKQLSFEVLPGSYQITGYDTRIYQSSFWIGDPEQIRVTPEVTSINQDIRVPPRLRRT